MILDIEQTHDLVIGPEVPHDHVGQKYTNSIVGRYANRVPVATHALERHGIKSNFNPLPNGAVKVLNFALAKKLKINYRE